MTARVTEKAFESNSRRNRLANATHASWVALECGVGRESPLKISHVAIFSKWEVGLRRSNAVDYELMDGAQHALCRRICKISLA